MGQTQRRGISTKKSSTLKDIFVMSRYRLFRRYVPTTTKATVQALAIHAQDWTYIVDSGASFHTMGISSLSPKIKRTIRNSEHILDIQTADGYVVSTLKDKVHIKELGIHLRVHLVEESSPALALGRLCNELGSSCSWPSGSIPKRTGKRGF